MGTAGAFFTEGAGAEQEGLGAQQVGFGLQQTGLGAQHLGLGWQHEGFGLQHEGFGLQQDFLGAQQDESLLPNNLSSKPAWAVEEEARNINPAANMRNCFISISNDVVTKGVKR
ncbi:MAG: hypothetical protein Tsb009_33490 [Planctomycetaceae bacterium]